MKRTRLLAGRAWALNFHTLAAEFTAYQTPMKAGACNLGSVIASSVKVGSGKPAPQNHCSANTFKNLIRGYSLVHPP